MISVESLKRKQCFFLLTMYLNKNNNYIKSWVNSPDGNVKMVVKTDRLFT